MNNYIPFNKPFFSEDCLTNIRETYSNVIQSGDGIFSRRIYDFFSSTYGFNKSLLTPSCTASLEMMAMLLNITPDDEIIIPSFTFVSTANAFVKFGAKIVFVDSCSDNPNIDPEKIQQCITSKTKALCIVHYAGIGCDMDKIVEICSLNNIILLEDAAQAIHSFYKGKPLGSFGDLSAFSFHETKNINCGEGGLLVINNPKYIERAEIIREKGTNRTAFFGGKVDKYQWIDIGSSYLLSDINAAYLYPQCKNIINIIDKRQKLWFRYRKNLFVSNDLGQNIYPFKIIQPEDNNCGNYHIFYILLDNIDIVHQLRAFLEHSFIRTSTHYVPLHQSKYYLSLGNENEIEQFKNSIRFSETLLRLPLYYDLELSQVDYICQLILSFFNH